MNFLAKKITLFFIRKKQIELDDYEVYVYCFELLLSSIFNTIILILGALVSHLYIETIIFAVALIISRKMFGGFHAKTHFGCLLLLTASYSIFALSFYVISENILSVISIVISALIILPIIFCAPVSHPNNPLPDKRVKQYKIISVMIAVFTLLLSILSFVCVFQRVGYILAFPIFCSAIAMVAGKKCYKN